MLVRTPARYFSPAVVDLILADPRRQELGGDVADVTILFADLGVYGHQAGQPERSVGVTRRGLQPAGPVDPKTGHELT
jgi:hypothetical protein